MWFAIFALARVDAAGAQTLDHLQCYKSRDPVKVDSIATLDSAQFGLEPGCKISRAAFICVPGSSSLASSAVVGQALQDSRICYKVKCPNAAAPDVQLGDQFGTRVFTGLKTSMLCTPAGEEPPTASTTTTTVAAPSGLFQNIGTYGVPASGYPSYLERTALVYVNAVRMAPLDYRTKYTYDTKFSLAAVDAMEAYPAVEPVRSAHGLHMSSRFHSQDMLLNNCFSHSSCDGTSWVARLNSFYSGGAGGENIAAGIPDPRVLVNAWLCDSTGKACCRDGASCDGHRRNIMTARFRASGMGYATNGAKHYWTQDLSGGLRSGGPGDAADRRRAPSDRNDEHEVPRQLSRRARRAALGHAGARRCGQSDDPGPRVDDARKLRDDFAARHGVPLLPFRGRRLGRPQVALSRARRVPHLGRRVVHAELHAVA